MSEEIQRVIPDQFRPLLHDLYYQADLAGTLTKAVLSDDRFFGYTAEEVIGKNIATEIYVNAEDRGPFLEMLEVDGLVRDFEVQVRAKDGEQLWVSINAAFLKGERGDVIGIHGIVRDISEAKSTATALQDSDDRFSGFVTQSAYGYAETDLEGRITFGNKLAIAITGYEVDDLKNLTFTHLLAPEDIERAMASFQDIFERPNDGTREYTVITKEGKRKPVEINAFVLKRDGRPAGIQVTILDISRRKQAEKDKEEAEARLQRAQRLEAIGTLAGGVAHDFNNLLTIIHGNLDLAMFKPELTPALGKDLKQIRKAAERAEGLIEQLLLFSRQQPMDFIPFNINSTVEAILVMLRRLIGEDITIETDLSVELFNVVGDPSKIEQIIVNLCVNARDAMPNGGKITIRTENVIITPEEAQANTDMRAGEFACLAVSDAGTGMDAATLERVFEPFFTTKEAGKGTGLGLAVAYGIIQEHSGWIHVESSPGDGALFRICLPGTAHSISDERGKESVEDIPSGNGERILIVEDEEDVLSLVTDLLRSLNYEVLVAPDAEAGARIFAEEQGRFDLVVSDIVLPGQDGLSLIEDLKQENPDLPVLLMSGYTDDKSRMPLIKERGYPYLHKPFTVRVFCARIRGVLAGQA